MDTQPGRPYSPKFRIVDANGSPVLSGVTGTITVYPPTSATVGVLVAAALTHLGDGYWGPAASVLYTALGTYKWVTSALTGLPSSGTWGAQSGTFTVGQTDEWPLRRLYTAVRRGLRDGWTGTTDVIGTTTTLKASAFAYGAANDWVSSEITILEPGAVTDPNPLRVTAFTVAAGVFTFTPAVAGNVAVGTDFIIGNKDGEGFSHDEVWDAIMTAIDRRRALRRVSDQVLLTSAYLQYEYGVPPGWAKVDRVEYQPLGPSTTQWLPIGQPYAPFDPQRGILTLTTMPMNNALRITGWALPQPPSLMTDLVPGDGAQIRDDAIFELLSMSDDASDRQRAAMMQGGVMHARAGAALARL